MLGLAHAYQFARRGLKVLVCERHPRAQGASVRNFGMLWPIGQPAGSLAEIAVHSRQQWLDVLLAAGLWHNPVGSMQLAYHADEEQVLREFLADPRQEARGCRMLTPEEALARSPWLNPAGLRGGLFSPLEVCVDPRQVIAEIPRFLRQAHEVEFRFGTAVIGWEDGVVRTSAGSFSAERLVVCTGDDLCSLFPQAYAQAGLVRCKLQMLRSQPLPVEPGLGPMLAAGLTLRHYRSFADCPTLATVAQRYDAEAPEYGRFGVHVLVSQHGTGELTLGDSHEYGSAISPYDRTEIDDLILRYLRTFFIPPHLPISQRWHGHYLKHPRAPWFIAQPAENCWAVTGVGGAGMTLSFGLADRLAEQILGEGPGPVT